MLNAQVNLTPGALTASSSWFRVTGSTEDADPCMCAGQDVEIALAARDGYGNAISDLEADAVKAIATGNETCIRFEPYEVSPSLERLPQAVSGKAQPCHVTDVPMQQQIWPVNILTWPALVLSRDPADGMLMICQAFSASSVLA